MKPSQVTGTGDFLSQNCNLYIHSTYLTLTLFCMYIVHRTSLNLSEFICHWRKNISLLKYTPCWLTSVRLHHWDDTIDYPVCIFLFQLVHMTVIDTSLVFPHYYGMPFRRSLKSIVQSYLKREIQASVSCGHDSYEDARSGIFFWKTS